MQYEYDTLKYTSGMKFELFGFQSAIVLVPILYSIITMNITRYKNYFSKNVDYPTV